MFRVYSNVCEQPIFYILELMLVRNLNRVTSLLIIIQQPFYTLRTFSLKGVKLEYAVHAIFTRLECVRRVCVSVCVCVYV